MKYYLSCYAKFEVLSLLNNGTNYRLWTRYARTMHDITGMAHVTPVGQSL